MLHGMNILCYTFKRHDYNVKGHDYNVKQHDYYVTWHDYTVKRHEFHVVFGNCSSQPPLLIEELPQC